MRVRLVETVVAFFALTLAGVVLTGSDSVTGPAGEFFVDLAISTVIGIVAGVVLAGSVLTACSSDPVPTAVTVGWDKARSAVQVTRGGAEPRKVRPVAASRRSAARAARPSRSVATASNRSSRAYGPGRAPVAGPSKAPASGSAPRSTSR